ncbi:MAG: glycosyltransferase family 4 protein [Candidatus Methanomethyliaceae archaeon]|nr:glycosyltransferase family 4 protein [Candidatus Methanomethyliaceae archaeon]MDW7970614.1 glycosyltransferase family 4 protein [Nitrososphaerota archaeon]
MNICILAWEFPPRIIGGLGTYVYELTRHLVKMEHNIFVFTLNDGSLKTRELIGGVEVHRPKILDISEIFPDVVAEEIRRWGPGMRFFADLWLYNVLVSTKIVNDLIPNEKKSFDILSVHDWLSAMAGIILKKALKIPMVFHIHSTEKGRSLGDGSPLIDSLEHKTATYADKIITVSYAMKDELIALGFPTEKIEVVWNGVDPNKYSQDRVSREKIREIRTKYGISDNEKMILFIGRLTGVKGPDKLVLAMPHVISEFPNVKLVIVGKGEMEGELMRLSERLGISNRIIFNFNMLPEEERIAHYAACDLAVFPSLYEPFGIVALEAMSMKKPVVVGARGVSGMRESVVSAGPDQTGYHINPYDPYDIAMAIKMILRDESHMRRLGENGRKRVLSEFTWEKIAKRIEEIYLSLINLPR